MPGEADVKGEPSVELDRVALGDDRSVATGGPDPTLAADVLELNREAAELVDTVEEELFREPVETATGGAVETATGGAVEVPDVADEVARRIRESDVPETATDELEALGPRGMLDFGSRRRRDVADDGE
ncbi:hypothetical protein DP107_12865 [Haloglomus irregulare]|uniref:Uncharacterized protein n=1 Tax=Haloglomus irregulare TaxID=2234134 RepID=A0A554N7K2_9EURY|nr:hypothetical protein [Haloglomus irregulare]TSD13377.1 hypothetical protein DP107_12865 [Haloglomus irregulare]